MLTVLLLAAVATATPATQPAPPTAPPSASPAEDEPLFCLIDIPPPPPSRAATIALNATGIALIAGGTTGFIVSTGCSTDACGRVFGGALGLAPLAGGAMLVSYSTAFRGQVLHGADQRDRSRIGWIGAGLVTGGLGLVTASLVGVDSTLEPLATPGLVLTAAGLPLVAAQGIRNGRTRRTGSGSRLSVLPVLGGDTPGAILVGQF